MYNLKWKQSKITKIKKKQCSFKLNIAIFNKRKEIFKFNILTSLLTFIFKKKIVVSKFSSTKI